jgi:hypothetical protein
VALDKRLESREVARHRAIDQLPVGVHRAAITHAGQLSTHPFFDRTEPGRARLEPTPQKFVTRRPLVLS